MFFDKFKAAKKESDLQTVRLEMKVFKSALNDLISLTRQAIQTLAKAEEHIQKKKDKALHDSKSKKKTDAVTSTIFEVVMEMGTAMTERNIGEFLVPLGNFQPRHLAFVRYW